VCARARARARVHVRGACVRVFLRQPTICFIFAVFIPAIFGNNGMRKFYALKKMSLWHMEVCWCWLFCF